MGLLKDFSAPGFRKTGGEYWQNSITFATENVIKGEKTYKLKGLEKLFRLNEMLSLTRKTAFLLF